MTNFTCGKYKCKEVDVFKYLGVVANRKNEKHDIWERVQKGNSAFFCNKQIF